MKINAIKSFAQNKYAQAGFLFAAVSSPAMADGGGASGLSAAQTAVLAKVTELESFGWAIATAVTLALVGIKLFKKVTNRAS